MRSDLRTAQDRAHALLGTVEHRDLGPLRVTEAVAFARACGERDPRLLDPGSTGFQVHPLYLPSLLRGPDGGVDGDYREDGMFRDEVPGTDGLDVRLMAGGQSIAFHRQTPLGDPIAVRRTLDDVACKGRPGSEFLLMTVSKVFRAARAGALATVTERFIVR
ncbi:FAS1-like dehydratase domain-containing protein [Nocardia miyunensis]|uniref:FAS1-like dehydratase domain-containing protein n=1 Tax=Nocardia miyunensis TaxID=282684 RepID=UPI00082E272A|nr:MaoC family dehydratase N-terminal domain-containing protein [Nocardia miyunensis]